MPVMVGAEIYGEGEDDITDTIALALASGKPVKTSRPSPASSSRPTWLPNGWALMLSSRSTSPGNCPELSTQPGWPLPG